MRKAKLLVSLRKLVSAPLAAFFGRGSLSAVLLASLSHLLFERPLSHFFSISSLFAAARLSALLSAAWFSGFPYWRAPPPGARSGSPQSWREYLAISFLPTAANGSETDRGTYVVPP